MPKSKNVVPDSTPLYKMDGKRLKVLEARFFKTVKLSDVKGFVALIKKDPYYLCSRDRSFKTALHHASTYGHMDIVKLIVRETMWLDSSDYRGRTPLHCASITNRVDVVRALIDGGATVDAKDKNGWTPLMHAARNANVETFHLLKSFGADVDTTTNKKRTLSQLSRMSPSSM